MKTQIEEGSKLFIVEFGNPDTGNYISFGSSQKPLFVIAKNYDEAAEKATNWIEVKKTTASVLTSDGDLRINTDELKIKAIKLACEELVW